MKSQGNKYDDFPPFRKLFFPQTVQFDENILRGISQHKRNAFEISNKTIEFSNSQPIWEN